MTGSLRRRHAGWAFAVAALTLTAGRADAQSGATIRGTVTSEIKTPINGARVAIDQPPRVALTSANGEYTLRDLPAGSYTVTVTAIGREPE